MFSPRLVKYTPVVTTLLLEGGTLGQIVQMLRTGSSADQNILSWLSVGTALLLWLNWYHTFTPGQRFAIWATRVGLLMSATAAAVALALR